MQPKQFNLLAVAAVVSLIAAGAVHSAYNSFNDVVVSGQKLFPSLESRADATGSISLQQGETKLTFNKSADGKVWSLAERDGYPIDPQKIRQLVVSLGQAELIDRKTKNKDLYAKLDLGDPAVKVSDAKLVRLADSNNQTIAEVVIGKERREAFGSGQAGTYVRMPGDPQTWLAKVELNASMDVVDWVKPAFFKVDDQKIASLVVKEGDKPAYKIHRGEKKKDEKLAAFEFADVPGDRKTKAGVSISDFIKGISSLEMRDVRKAKADDAKPDMTAELALLDGTQFKIGMKREDKKRWITVAVAAEGKDAAAAKAVGEATKGWVFEIPTWRADQTFKKADEIFEVVETKEEAPKMSLPPQSAKPAEAAPSGQPAKGETPAAANPAKQQ